MEINLRDTNSVENRNLNFKNQKYIGFGGKMTENRLEQQRNVIVGLSELPAQYQKQQHSNSNSYENITFPGTSSE